VTALEDERALSARDNREDEERRITTGMDGLARLPVADTRGEMSRCG
jgi:hypothetical protein